MLNAFAKSAEGNNKKNSDSFNHHKNIFWYISIHRKLDLQQ